MLTYTYHTSKENSKSSSTAMLCNVSYLKVFTNDLNITKYDYLFNHNFSKRLTDLRYVIDVTHRASGEQRTLNSLVNVPVDAVELNRLLSLGRDQFNEPFELAEPEVLWNFIVYD